MTLEDIKKNSLLQTRAIAEACKDSPETFDYIISCLARFFGGDYGEVPPEDTEANNKDLEAGEGHVLARYRPAGNLAGDIYIEAYFSASMPGMEANNTMIMYTGER